MKSFKKYIVWALLLSVFIMTGCNVSLPERRKFIEQDKVSIVTSIYPMYDFASKIAGDKAEIYNLVPAGIEPHDFELTTGDMQLLETADLFIYNGAGMEHFVDQTMKSVSNKDLLVVEAAEHVDLIEAKEQEEHHGLFGHEHHEKYDPHTWLSIRNAMKEAEAIKDALVSIDSANQGYYEENYQVLLSQLEDLEQEYTTQLREYSGQTIVVAHEAFGYLCNEYGLSQLAVEGLTSDSEPDSARMAEIVEFCKAYNIDVIFFEELVSPKVAQTIADEVGAKTDVLYTIEGRTPSQEAENIDYIAMMRQNLEVLQKAFSTKE